MNKIDEWIKPGAIVPITHESVQLLVEHIKSMYGIKEPVKTKMAILYHKGRHEYVVAHSGTWFDRHVTDLIGYFEVQK